MYVSIAARNTTRSGRFAMIGVIVIRMDRNAASTARRGSVAREIPAERERVASVGRFCGVAQEHSLHGEEVGG
jgi:hypothetical protein